MTHRRSFEDFNHALSVSAQIPNDLDREHEDPTEARQFAVQRPDGSEPVAYGDQEWVKYGNALTAMKWPRDGGGLVEPEGSTIVERDITITYGPWRPVGEAPDTALLAEAQQWPGQRVRIEGDRRASVEELSAILLAEFGGHRPSETSVHAAIRILRDQQVQLNGTRTSAEYYRKRHAEVQQELGAVRQLLALARAEATRDREIAAQLAPLLAEFKTEGPEALMADASIDVAALETLQALVGDTDG